MVSENFEGENWTGANSKANTLQLYQPNKVTDLRKISIRSKRRFYPRNFESDSLGTAFYQRNVKTLIKIGKKKNHPGFSTDLPLDIIPLLIHTISI